MRRLAIQLLREAPSPTLRAAASLAQAYQPLSRELFSAAFACCWRELTEAYRANLVHALETAFVADGLPIEIGRLSIIMVICERFLH
jgi:serine/threonine-protein kinase mTOR